MRWDINVSPYVSDLLNLWFEVPGRNLDRWFKRILADSIEKWLENKIGNFVE